MGMSVQPTREKYTPIPPIIQPKIDDLREDMDQDPWYIKMEVEDLGNRVGWLDNRTIAATQRLTDALYKGGNLIGAADLTYNIGTLFFQEKNHVDAKKYLEKSLQIRKDLYSQGVMHGMGQIHLQLGLTHLALGNTKFALPFFHGAMRSNTLNNKDYKTCLDMINEFGPKGRNP